MKAIKFALILFFIILFSACGSGGTDTASNSDTGSITFKVEFEPHFSKPIDSDRIIASGSEAISYATGDICVDYNISTINASVLDSSGTAQKTASWSCSAHSGTISSVPVGSNYTVRLDGADSSGAVSYRGEKTGITVAKDQTTSAGTVTMTSLGGSIPSAPTGVTATAGSSQTTISWTAVTVASSYNIYWSTTSGVTKTTGTKITGATSSYTHTGLTNGTTYYYVVTAVNSYAESSESSRVSATPTSGGITVTDIDGNVYNTVPIGTQVWFKENLKVTKYRNGDTIPTTTSSISNDTSSKYQWAYNGDESNVSTYGRLYTWYTATDSRGLCPAGSHLPTDVEWTTLTDYLGGLSVAGGKLKEAGTTHWSSPNTGADNSSGFTALPGGYRYGSGSFSDMGYYGGGWSATEYGTLAWDRKIDYNTSGVGRISYYKNLGFSVRCVMD